MSVTVSAEDKRIVPQRVVVDDYTGIVHGTPAVTLDGVCRSAQQHVDLSILTGARQTRRIQRRTCCCRHFTAADAAVVACTVYTVQATLLPTISVQSVRCV